MIELRAPQVAAQLGDRARVVKVNVDEAGATAGQFGITSIPTFAVIQGGKVVQRFSGVVPKNRLLEAINSLEAPAKVGQ